MGIRMPIGDWLVGDACESHPQPENTPKIIYAYFWGIEACLGSLVPPNLHVFSLYQDEEDPSKWANVVDGFGWIVELEWDAVADQAVLELYRAPADVYFYGRHALQVYEHDAFANLWWDCIGAQKAKFGCACLFWHERSLELVEGLNLHNDGNLFMEFFITEDLAPVYKFCYLDHFVNEKVLLYVDEFVPGSIILWYGSIVSIPDGWHLCDGTGGTPDLRNKFAMGASLAVPPHDECPEILHSHDFATDYHSHILLEYGRVMDIHHVIGVDPFTDSKGDSGTTDSSYQYPPWRALCYIMKL